MQYEDMLRAMLNTATEAGQQSNKECAESLTKYGAAYTAQWMQRYIKADIEGGVAQMLLEVWNKKGLAEASEYAFTQSRNELSYIIPDSNNAAEKVYRAQALQKFARYMDETLEGMAS